MNDDDDEEGFAPDGAPSLDAAGKTPKEPAPAAPASEPAEAAPTPAEQKRKPGKTTAPTSH